MKPIFGSQGEPVGWLIEYNKVVVDALGRCRAFCSDGGVFSYEGTYLGEFAQGYFWDRLGEAVAFIEGASDGPPLPTTETPPPAPIPGMPPIQPMVPEPPEPAAHSGRWSRLTFEAFLEQGAS